MKFLTVDDEVPALSILNQCILEAAPGAEIRSFSDSAEAAAEICENGFRPDVAFLDVRMPGMSSLEIAKRIQSTSPRTNIVFVTAYTDYALDAISLHPSGYIMKPPDPDRIRAELNNLLYPCEQNTGSRIRVQCFGNFEIFADGKPVSFCYQKTKELLAYLVDRRGAACNTAKLCAVLWENKPDSSEMKNYLRKLLSDLSRSLAAVGAESMLIKRRNRFSVAADQFDCDYYRMLERDISAINAFSGEYMSQYSWAEMTLGRIERGL